MTDACAHSTKKFGERHLKQFKIVSLGSWGLRVNQRCRCPGGVHIPLMERSETGAVSGTPALKASQAYPTKLGESVVAAWLAGKVDPSELKVPSKGRKSKRAAEEQPGSTERQVSESSGTASWQQPAVPAASHAKPKNAGKHARKSPGGSAPSWAKPAPP